MSFRVLHIIFGFVRTSQDSPLASLAGFEPATCRLGELRLHVSMHLSQLYKQ